MSTALTQPLAAEIERVLVQGDIGKLTPDQRMDYYRNMCASLGLNPMTRPFEYLTLQGKTLLYAKKDATDQLRKIHGVSINIVSRETIDGVYVVTARATDAKGRQDESLGALPLPANPVERANAIMKCETKAKRRVTLSICGLGMLDETDIETIGSKENQREYLAERGLEAYVADKKLPPATKPEVIRELAETLDQQPSVRTIEMRHAKQVAEADAALKEVAKPVAKQRKTGAVTFDVLKHFGDIKKLLNEVTGNDEVYYNTLKAYGYAKSNEIKDNDQAREIWKALATLHKRATEDAKLRTEFELVRQVHGDKFMSLLGAHGCESVDDVLCLASEPLQALLAEIKELR